MKFKMISVVVESKHKLWKNYVFKYQCVARIIQYQIYHNHFPQILNF